MGTLEILLLCYFIPLILALPTVNYMLYKEISFVTALFLIFCPVINLFWTIYRLYMTIKTQRSIFIEDLKKLFVN